MNAADASTADDAQANDGREWIDSYRRRRSEYEEFTRRLHALLRDLLKEDGIDVVQIDARAKEVDSFAEKVRRKQDQYDDPLLDVTDLVGLRVITYYVEDVARVGKIVEREFEVDSANSVDKGHLLGPDQFGYMSVHYVAKLDERRAGLPEWNPFQGMAFEVQIRTALQHAWAAVDHKLRYKTLEDVPDDLKRNLYRLSALFELADEQFAALRDASNRLRKQYKDQVTTGDLGIPVNADSIEAYLRGTSKFDAICTRAANAGWGLLRAEAEDDNRREWARSTLLAALQAVKIETIEEFDRLLSNTISENPGFLEEFVKLVRVMPDRLLAMIVLHEKAASKGKVTRVLSDKFWQRLYAFRNGRTWPAKNSAGLKTFE